MALKLSAMEESRSENAWRMVYVARPVGDLSEYDILTSVPSSFEEKEGQLREWMTVARDRSAWGRRLNTS
jgi:hypothetical protein